MLIDDVLLLAGNNPVLLDDGLLGLLLVFPREGGLCGVQVPGEESHRWIAADDLSASKEGALRQRGAPIFPSAAHSNTTQLMLEMDWKYRGGADIPWTVTL